MASPTITVNNNRGPLRKAGRYLIDNSGVPILLMGDAAWSAIVMLTTAQMDTYLADRESRGFNLVLVELIERFFGADPPNTTDGIAPFTGANFTAPNENYFLRADYFIKKAAALGIYVVLVPLYLGFSGTEEGWDTEVAAASTGDMTTWGAYCANRYKNYDNIIWAMGGDTDPTALIAKVDACAEAIAANDPNHLITLHGGGQHPASYYVDGKSWFTLNNSYATLELEPEQNKNAYDYSSTMPFFHIEGWYENENGITVQGLRAQAYWAYLGGAFGHIFGNDPIWNFAYDGVASDWINALDDAGSVGMTHCASLFRSKAWYTLVPDYAHTWLTVGYGTLGNVNYAGAAKNAAGTLGMIYMPSNRTMTVDMSIFVGSVTARWYDPTNGSYTADAASPVANSGTHDFSRATANNAGAADWVLVLEV